MVRLWFDEKLRVLLRRRVLRGEGVVDMERTGPVKDLIESVGIPHTEVGAILVAQRRADFRTVPARGDRVAVFAPQVPMDVTRSDPLRSLPLEAPRFLVDVNVERLGRLLRLAGFDTAPSRDEPDRRLADRAVREGRIVLTRDRLLLMRGVLMWGRLVRAHRPWDQLEEVVRFFGLVRAMKPFSRCPVCNMVLEDVSADQVWHLLEPLTQRYYRHFRRCPACGKVYWAGSHHARAMSRLDRIRGSHGPVTF